MPVAAHDSGMFKRTRSSSLLVALALGALFVSGPSVSRAEDEAPARPKALRGLSGDAALEHVKVMTSDEMGGRKTGIESGKKAEEWAAMIMAEYGLNPVDHGGTYLEPFRFTAGHVDGPIELRVGDKVLDYGVDYFDLIYSGAGKVEAEVVFVGFGISRPDLGWDDYAGLDVEGKIVLAMRGAPQGKADTLAEERYIGYKSSTAASKGAVGFLLAEGAKPSTGTIQARFHAAKLPALWVAGPVAKVFLASRGLALADARSKAEPGQGFATGVRVAMEVRGRKIDNALGHNVLGAIKGRDPDLKDEVIVVGAHLDHLGVAPDGQVFNGADDNASGTAVMLHLADLLTRNRWKPKRTIVFVAFGAEEQGLHGSRALAESGLPFSHGGIACLLNMDMVGQGEPVVRVVGTSAFPRVAAHLESALPDRLKPHMEFSRVTGGFGDHWPFWRRGVPAFFVATKGKHPNYHTPIDDVERIDPKLLETTADVIGHLLLSLGEHPEPLLDGGRDFTRFLLREGPRFVKHPAGSPLPEDGHALVEQGIGALIVDVPCASVVAGTKALKALVPESRSDLMRARGAADVRRAWREGRLAILPRAICQAVLREEGGAVALRKAGAVILAPFVDDGSRDMDPAALAKACVPAGILLDLAGLDPAQAADAYGARGDLMCVHVGAWAAGTATPLGRLPKGARVLRLWTPKLDPQITTKFDTKQDVVLLHADTPGLEKFVSAWGNLRSDMWWKPDSEVRKAVRATFGGRFMTWMADLE